MLIPPGWFLLELEAFDPLLRLRWSDQKKMWQLERKVTVGLPPESFRKDTEHDDFIRAREKYVLVASIPAGGLNRQIFDNLRASDLWAQGGWDKVERDLVEAEKVAEEKSWLDFGEEVRFKAADAYEHWKCKTGQTVYLASGK